MLLAGCQRVSKPDGWAPPVHNPEANVIYASRDGGKLSALDTSGDLGSFPQLWRFPPSDSFPCENATESKRRDLRGIYGAPVVADGLVYFGAYDGNVYALDETDGHCVWLFEGTDGPIVGGLTLSGDTLYFGSDDGNLYGLDPANGAIKTGPFDAGDAIWTTPLIAENVMYFSTVGGRVFALTTGDLHPAWNRPFQTSAGLLTDPVIAGEGENAVLVVGGIGEKLFGLDPGTGTEVWEKPFEGGNWFWGPPAIDGDKLYYPNLDHKVYAIDSTTGTALWDKPFAAEEAIRAAPVLVNDVLAVVDRKGNVFSIDPATGKGLLQTPIRLDSKVLADPIEFGDGMLVLADNGRLLQVDPTGETPPRVVQTR
jgi:outer membrane protein assembly factor BamB